MEEQVLIPMSAEVFWSKMRSLIMEVLEERAGKSCAVGKHEAPRLLKMKEVCELFTITKPTIYEWMRKGQLKSIKIESRRFFLIEDIEFLISAQNKS